MITPEERKLIDDNLGRYALESEGVWTCRKTNRGYERGWHEFKLSMCEPESLLEDIKRVLNPSEGFLKLTSLTPEPNQLIQWLKKR